MALGHRRIAGVDEVGRGCLFGPVYAAAVILSPDKDLLGLDDSKRLSRRRREALAGRIREGAVACAVGSADADEIDAINILQASRLAMKRAVEALDPCPDFLLVDAIDVACETPQRGVIKGDSRSCSIAAASILAKVSRDACMLEWDKVYPQYGLRSHKGYPSPAHLAALSEWGCTPQHRRSFAPVSRVIEASATRSG